MKYYFLASGSSGNATILINDNNEILLIDCGISINEITSKIISLGYKIEDIKKVLITHMHVDHVKSIRAFDLKDVYIHVDSQMNEANLFDYYQTFEVLGFKILTLPASHDSLGTTGFLIEYNNEKMAYITDTGYVHENIQRLINNCDIYCIESNHDPRMLMLTNRPRFLKQRILSPNGHLSNQDCAYVLGNVIGPRCKEINFLHRSLEANSEDMIMATFTSTMEKMKIDISHITINIAKQKEIVQGGAKTTITN